MLRDILLFFMFFIIALGVKNYLFENSEIFIPEWRCDTKENTIRVLSKTSVNLLAETKNISSGDIDWEFRKILREVENGDFFKSVDFNKTKINNIYELLDTAGYEVKDIKLIQTNKYAKQSYCSVMFANKFIKQDEIISKSIGERILKYILQDQYENINYNDILKISKVLEVKAKLLHNKKISYTTTETDGGIVFGIGNSLLYKITSNQSSLN